jgi:SUMO ligase MMS21 Smc5/6 complex component
MTNIDHLRQTFINVPITNVDNLRKTLLELGVEPRQTNNQMTDVNHLRRTLLVLDTNQTNDLHGLLYNIDSSENESSIEINEQKRIDCVVLDESKVDEKMICPISQEIMVYPMTTKCNHTFDKKMIEHWLQKHGTCPLCRSEILWPDLRENIDLVKEMTVLKFKVNQNDVEK